MTDNFWTKLNKPILALAPLAGFTDSAFRQIATAYGADVVYSEMASATALFYDSAATAELLRYDPAQEKNYVVQLFGSEPEHFIKAAHFVTERIKPQGLDINFGCPVPKVLRQGAGAQLMADLPRAREVIAAVCQATDLPVSVKIRARSGSVTALDFLKNIAGLPVAAVMIHGRSLRQGFAGEIDYALIKEARHYFSGIILANGGINDLAQAKKTLALTEADGLGLARGALGRPWLFTEIKQDQKLDLTAADMAEVIRRQAKLFRQIKGDEAFPELRKHLCWYVQGIPGASHYRAQLVKVASYQDLDNILNELKTNI